MFDWLRRRSKNQTLPEYSRAREMPSRGVPSSRPDQEANEAFSARCDSIQRWLDLRNLLTSPAPREDCPQTLVSPAAAPRHRGIFEKELIAGITALDHLVEGVLDKVETVIDDVLGGAVDDEPLPDSGNIIGFLHILLKTELECSQLNGEDEAEQVRILENFKKIKTKNKAQAYVKYMRDKIEATKRRASPKYS